jgi:hypothetical protein
MRVALADQSLGLKIANKAAATTRIKIPAKYTTDLDFADDIMLVSVDAINSQKQLDSVDILALEDEQSEDRVYDGRTLGVSHRITRFYWYNKSSQRLQVFRILAAKLH